MHKFISSISWREGLHAISSQRKRGIIEYLSDTDYRTLRDIVDEFAISINIAQRDINGLAKENLVKKFCSGVSLVRKKDNTFQDRVASHIEEKQRIAKYTATLVNDNDLLHIDSGSAISLLTDYLHEDFHSTIITNNIYVIIKVIEAANWDLIVVGSRLKRSSCPLINVCDQDYLNSLNVNKVFLATTRLTIQGGAINSDNAETIIKTGMMKRSQEDFLLTNSPKFDRTSLRTFTDTGDFGKIIISESVPKHFVEYCAAGSTQLITA